MIVGEVMSKKLYTVKKGDTLKKAQDLMVTNAVRHLPVLDGDELFGIITESDIRGAFINQGRSRKDKIQVLDPAKMKVSEYMTRNPMVVVPPAKAPVAKLVMPMARSAVGAVTWVVKSEVTSVFVKPIARAVI